MPAFTVKVEGQPSQGEGIKQFKFNSKTGVSAMEAAAEPDDGTQKKAQMVAWRGVKGSCYAEGLFRAFPMPDGKTVMHFHHKQQTLSTEHPGAEPGEQALMQHS